MNILIKEKNKVKFFFRTIMTVIFLIAICSCPKKNPDKTESIVLAVNSIKVYEDEVMKGVPEEGFGLTKNQAISARASRLKNIILIKGLMEKYKIEVTEQDVDEDIENLRKTPPAASCSCCCYASLEEFMEYNYFTMPDLREYSRIILGFDKYATQLWDKECSTKAKKEALVNSQREELEQKYMKASHIFFNCFQDPGFTADSKAVIAKKEKLAQAAWQRLNSGEPFAEVARQVSEDIVSKPAGGSLGCIWGDEFGIEFKSTLTSLPDGQYSKPITGIYGVHIVKKEAMTDEDILEILKEDFIGKTQSETYSRLMDEAVIKIEDPYRWLAEYM